MVVKNIIIQEEIYKAQKLAKLNMTKNQLEQEKQLTDKIIQECNNKTQQLQKLKDNNQQNAQISATISAILGNYEILHKKINANLEILNANLALLNANITSMDSECDEETAIKTKISIKESLSEGTLHHLQECLTRINFYLAAVDSDQKRNMLKELIEYNLTYYQKKQKAQQSDVIVISSLSVCLPWLIMGTALINTPGIAAICAAVSAVMIIAGVGFAISQYVKNLHPVKETCTTITNFVDAIAPGVKDPTSNNLEQLNFATSDPTQVEHTGGESSTTGQDALRLSILVEKTVPDTTLTPDSKTNALVV